MEKIPTFKLTEEGQIDAISLGMASSDDSKLVFIIEDREGNFYNLGKDGELHPLPKTQEEIIKHK